MESFAASQPDLVKVLIQSTYVDNMVFGADSEECAFEMYCKLKALLEKEDLVSFWLTSVPPLLLF